MQRRERYNIHCRWQKTPTHNSADNLTPSPSDPVASAMTNRPQNGESRDLVCVGGGSAFDRPSTNTDNTNVISYWPTIHAGIWPSVSACVCVRREERKTKREEDSVGFADLLLYKIIRGGINMTDFTWGLRRKHLGQIQTDMWKMFAVIPAKTQSLTTPP